MPRISFVCQCSDQTGPVRLIRRIDIDHIFFRRINGRRHIESGAQISAQRFRDFLDLPGYVLRQRKIFLYLCLEPRQNLLRGFGSGCGVIHLQKADAFVDGVQDRFVIILHPGIQKAVDPGDAKIGADGIFQKILIIADAVRRMVQPAGIGSGSPEFFQRQAEFFIGRLYVSVQVPEVFCFIGDLLVRGKEGAAFQPFLKGSNEKMRFVHRKKCPALGKNFIQNLIRHEQPLSGLLFFKSGDLSEIVRKCGQQFQISIDVRLFPERKFCQQDRELCLNAKGRSQRLLIIIILLCQKLSGQPPVHDLCGQLTVFAQFFLLIVFQLFPAFFQIGQFFFPGSRIEASKRRRSFFEPVSVRIRQSIVQVQCVSCDLMPEQFHRKTVEGRS